MKQITEKEMELRALDAFCAEFVTCVAKVIQQSQRRWQARYHISPELPSGVGRGGFKSVAEAWEYLHFQIAHPSTNPADAMEVLKACEARCDMPIEVDRKRDHNGPWRVETGPKQKGYLGIAPTLETAICIFAKHIFSK